MSRECQHGSLTDICPECKNMGIKDDKAAESPPASSPKVAPTAEGVTALRVSHTPGPWMTGLPTESEDMQRMVYADDSLGSRIADCSTAGHGVSKAQELANAAFIVRACNSHDDLVAALRDLVSALDVTDVSGFIETVHAKANARAVLAKVSP